jgi:hypothetical protein
VTGESVPDSPSEGTSLCYIPALDGVRAIAVISVMAYHGGIADRVRVESASDHCETGSRADEWCWLMMGSIKGRMEPILGGRYVRIA